MPAREAPQPPYVLLFQQAEPGALPLAFRAGDRAAVPLFGSEAKARAFLDAADFGPGWEPVELSTNGLLRVLEDCRELVGHVALDPPPAAEGGVKVEMGGVEELIDALRGNPEDDPLGLGR